MSYNFSIRAADKAAAKAQVAEKVAEVVHSQPVHAVDQSAILANANAFIDMLPEAKEDHEIAGNLSGYVSGEWANGELVELTSARIEASIGWVRKA